MNEYPPIITACQKASPSLEKDWFDEYYDLPIPDEKIEGEEIDERGLGDWFSNKFKKKEKNKIDPDKEWIVNELRKFYDHFKNYDYQKKYGNCNIEIEKKSLIKEIERIEDHINKWYNDDWENVLKELNFIKEYFMKPEHIEVNIVDLIGSLTRKEEYSGYRYDEDWE